MKERSKLLQSTSLDRYRAVLYIHSTVVRYSTPSYFPLFKKIKSTIDIDNEEIAGQGRAEQCTVGVSCDPHCTPEQHATQHDMTIMAAHNMA